MTKGFALALVAILCLAGQTPADEVVSAEQTAADEFVPKPTPVENKPEGSNTEMDSSLLSEYEGPAVPMSVEDPVSAERWWFSTDYLLAWIRGSLLQPLVTTSPPGTPVTSAGVLGKKGTSTVLGNGDFNNDVRSGFKVGAGGWFDADRTLGVDLGFFVLESQNTLFFASSNGNTILARPFFNTLKTAQDSQVVAFPGVASGSIGASLRSNNLYSGHVDFQEIFLNDSWFRLISIVGYRYLRFDERLLVFQDVTSLGKGGIAAGTTIQTTDNFTVHNNLNAFDLGLRTEFLGERWSLDLLFKMAVGRLEREVTIAGQTLTTAPGDTKPTGNPGGFLALESNSGRNSFGEWIVVPELGVNLGYNLTSRLRLHLGYDVLFWSNVARASDQVSLLINPNLFPPPKTSNLVPFTPQFSLVRSDMWVQAINLGLEFRY